LSFFWFCLLSVLCRISIWLCSFYERFQRREIFFFWRNFLCFLIYTFCVDYDIYNVFCSSFFFSFLRN
jgi:hypothetical protein